MTPQTPSPFRWPIDYAESSPQARRQTQRSGRTNCTSTWHSNRPYYTPTNIRLWTSWWPSHSMPVRQDRINAGLGVDMDKCYPHSPNPQSLCRVLEHPTQLDLGVGDMDMDTEAALMRVKPIHCLAEVGHSLSMALSQQAMSPPPHLREGRGSSPLHKVVSSICTCHYSPI
jgi:hypothetical protein